MGVYVSVYACECVYVCVCMCMCVCVCVCVCVYVFEWMLVKYDGVASQVIDVVSL